MASSLPNDILRQASQRFLYNIDLIEKRFANKRPSGLELDVDTGKIIQVVDAKRPRLTVEEAKEKMKTSFLAPPSFFGNSSLCSPFVHDMTTSRSTKKRVLKHNRRFQQQLDDGMDLSSTLLNDENDNNEASEDEENREEEELFDLDDIFDDDADDEEEEEGADGKLSESEDEEIGPFNDQNQELEDELDNEKEDEETFEVPEEEAEKEGNTYKNVKITRALIKRLTPKAAKVKKIPKLPKKRSSVIDGTSEATRKEKDTTSDTKKDVVESIPVRESKKITKTLSAKSVSKTKTPTVSTKVIKSASEKATSKKENVSLTVNDTPIKSYCRSRKSAQFNETVPKNGESSTVLKVKKSVKAITQESSPITSSPALKKIRGRPAKITADTVSKEKKITKTATNTPSTVCTLKKASRLSRQSIPKAAPINVTPATVSNNNIIIKADSTPKKPRGRPRTCSRKSIA